MNSNSLTSAGNHQSDYRRIQNHPSNAIHWFEKLAIKHIKENMLDTRFKMVHLCKLMNTSRTSLYRKLLNYTGKTFSELIRENQITKAQQLLRTAGLNVTETSYRLGFQDTSNFIKFFKRETGMTPGRYRNIIQNSITAKRQK